MTLAEWVWRYRMTRRCQKAAKKIAQRIPFVIGGRNHNLFIRYATREANAFEAFVRAHAKNIEPKQLETVRPLFLRHVWHARRRLLLRHHSLPHEKTP